MALSFLFYKNRDYSIFDENNVTIISFDLILSENHNFSSEATEYYVEDGSNISDNIKINYFNGNISGFISNFSIYENGIFINRSQEAFNILEELSKKKILVDIYTVLKVYRQVVITGISVSRDSGSGESLTCNINFQEFRKVQLKEIFTEITVNLKNMNTTINKQISPNKNIGKNQGIYSEFTR